MCAFKKCPEMAKYDFHDWLVFLADLELATQRMSYHGKMNHLRMSVSSDVSKYLGHLLFHSWPKSDSIPPSRGTHRDSDKSKWQTLITIITEKLKGRDDTIIGDAYSTKGLINGFMDGRVTSTELWTGLGLLESRRVITFREVLECFWNAHSSEKQQALLALTPCFDPNHSIWTRRGYKSRRSPGPFRYASELSPHVYPRFALEYDLAKQGGFPWERGQGRPVPTSLIAPEPSNSVEQVHQTGPKCHTKIPITAHEENGTQKPHSALLQYSSNEQCLTGESERYREVKSEQTLPMAEPLEELGNSLVLDTSDLEWILSLTIRKIAEWVKHLSLRNSLNDVIGKRDYSDIAQFLGTSSELTSSNLQLVTKYYSTALIFAHVIELIHLKNKNPKYDHWTDHSFLSPHGGKIARNQRWELDCKCSELLKLAVPMVYELLTEFTGFIIKARYPKDESQEYTTIVSTKESVDLDTSYTAWKAKNTAPHNDDTRSAKRVKRLRRQAMSCLLNRDGKRAESESWMWVLTRIFNSLGLRLHQKQRERLIVLDDYSLYMSFVRCIAWLNLEESFFEAAFATPDSQTSQVLKKIRVYLASACIAGLCGPWHGARDQGSLNFVLEQFEFSDEVDQSDVTIKNEGKFKYANCSAVRRYLATTRTLMKPDVNLHGEEFERTRDQVDEIVRGIKQDLERFRTNKLFDQGSASLSTWECISDDSSVLSKNALESAVNESKKRRREPEPVTFVRQNGEPSTRRIQCMNSASSTPYGKKCFRVKRFRASSSQQLPSLHDFMRIVERNGILQDSISDPELFCPQPENVPNPQQQCSPEKNIERKTPEIADSTHSEEELDH